MAGMEKLKESASHHLIFKREKFVAENNVFSVREFFGTIVGHVSGFLNFEIFMALGVIFFELQRERFK